MILKLANSLEEQNFEVDIENEDINVDDIGAGMLCNKLGFLYNSLYESSYI